MPDLDSSRVSESLEWTMIDCSDLSDVQLEEELEFYSQDMASQIDSCFEQEEAEVYYCRTPRHAINPVLRHYYADHYGPSPPRPMYR